MNKIPFIILALCLPVLAINLTPPGTLTFAEDATFYRNKPETILRALTHPDAPLLRKRALVFRMARDLQLPVELWDVLFDPAAHADLEVSRVIIEVIFERRPGSLKPALVRSDNALRASLQVLRAGASGLQAVRPTEIGAAELTSFRLHQLFLDLVTRTLLQRAVTRIDEDTRRDVRGLAAVFLARPILGTALALVTNPNPDAGRGIEVGTELLECYLRLARVLVRLEDPFAAAYANAIVLVTADPKFPASLRKFRRDALEVAATAGELARGVDLDRLSEHTLVALLDDAKNLPAIVKALCAIPNPEARTLVALVGIIPSKALYAGERELIRAKLRVHLPALLVASFDRSPRAPLDAEIVNACARLLGTP